MSAPVRPAQTADDAALAGLDRQCWSALANVVPARGFDMPFFGHGQSPEDILVATRQGVVVGWVKLVPPTPLASNAHVQQLQGLGVHPAQRGKGIARALVSAALDLARSREARKVCLRVLATNQPAQALYQSVGFTVEGVLVDEFFLGGQYVDDILMARLVDPNASAAGA